MFRLSLRYNLRLVLKLSNVTMHWKNKDKTRHFTQLQSLLFCFEVFFGH